MLEEITRALGEIAAPYRDTRLHHCQVEAAALDGPRCVLTGTVLNDATQAALLAGLTTRFPDLRFDPAGVRVLRSSETETRAARNEAWRYEAVGRLRRNH